MAEKSKTEKAAAEKVEAPKHFITITDAEGKYAPASLEECNRTAYGAAIGRKRREAEALKHVTAAVKFAMRRAG